MEIIVDKHLNLKRKQLVKAAVMHRSLISFDNEKPMVAALQALICPTSNRKFA